ncbi:MAG: oligosaccharide flippase family protein [Rikenellaceae bacterium]|nr:oligosaccharide flippase family protein [Rikenellaceae bacterium]
MLRKLAGQTAVYGISTIGVRLLNYVLVPYLTRILSKEQFGVYTDIYAVIPFLLVVLTLGMETGFFRFYNKAPTEAEKKQVFQSVWGTVSLAGTLFLLLLLLFLRPVAGWMQYSEYPSFVWLMGAIVWLDVLTAIPFAKLRAQNRALRFVWIRFFSVVVHVALCFFFYSGLPRIPSLSALWNPGYGPGYAFVANLIQSATVLLLLLPTLKGCMPKIDKKVLRPVFLYSLPLLIAGIPGVANEFIDRQLLKYIQPAGENLASLGGYGAVTKLAVIMTLFVQMYRYGAEPFFLAEFKQNEFQRTNAEAMKYFVIVSIAIFLGITYFTDLFGLILGQDFRTDIRLLPIILLANVFAGIVLNLSFWYKHSGLTRYAAVITGTGLIFTVSLNLILIPRIGNLGAAWSRLVCEMVMAVISYGLCQKYFPIPYNLRRIGTYFLTGILFYAVGMAVNGYLPRSVSIPLDLLLLGGFCIFVARMEKIKLKNLLTSLRKK